MTKDKKDKPYDRYKLQNGLEVVLYSMDEVRAVCIYLGLKAGVSNESANQAGTLHFLEHVILQGPVKYKSESEFIRFGDYIGATYNGMVSNFDTKYWFTCPSSKLEEMINFVSDFLRYPAFREEDIEKTRSVILSEISGASSSAESKYTKKGVALLFGRNSPYSLKGFGKVEVVEKVNRNDLLATYRKYYQPQNIKLVLTGKFDPQEAKFFLSKHFGDWERGKKVVDYPKIEWTYKVHPRIFVYDTLGDHVDFEIFFPHLGFMQRSRKDARIYYLINYLICGNGNARVYKRLRIDLGLVYRAGSGFNVRPYAGVFGIYGDSKVENIEIVLKETYNALKEIAKDGFEEEEFVLARNYLNMRMYADFSGIFNIASDFLDQVIDDKEIYMPEDYEKLTNSITLKEVNEYTFKLLNFKKARLMMFGGKKKIDLKVIRKDFLEFCGY
ncbi:MAG: insulinase family protein [Patescibacteria group bacterium]|nr:insulinase family protein [Patescibacteria group bacterium]